MDITSAKYCEYNGENTSINIVIDGVQIAVPLDSANRHYAEIMRQVAAGELTIADAD
tara:strand:- start:19 stop:189 length:171 start_codon:yes stop_codon:yes gene_type:complete